MPACIRRRSTSASQVRCIRPSAASVWPTSARETTRSGFEPRRWPATARGPSLWISTWPNVRIGKTPGGLVAGEVAQRPWTDRSTLIHPTGYPNSVYAMVFVPIAVVLFVCLLITMLVLVNKKRFVGVWWRQIIRQKSHINCQQKAKRRFTPLGFVPNKISQLLVTCVGDKYNINILFCFCFFFRALGKSCCYRNNTSKVV